MSYSPNKNQRRKLWFKDRDVSRYRLAAKARHLATKSDEERHSRFRMPHVSIQHKPEDKTT